jgi:hypothetical protein
MSTAAFAAKEQHAPGRLGKEARLAKTFSKFRKHKSGGGGLRAHIAGMKKAGKFSSASY